MKYKENISNVHRYIINDIDRSPYIRLDKNEFNAPFPKEVLEDLRESLTDYLIQAYPSTYQTVRSAALLLRHPKEEEILLTPGSDYGLKICYESFVNAGEKVAFPWPTYAMNEVYAALATATPEHLSYSPDLHIDREHLFRSLDKVSMVVLANPNQPTGLLEEDSLIESLLVECAERKIWTIIDEAYFDFSGQTAAKHISTYPNLIVLRSFSKGFGMAGLRIGAILSQGKNIEYLTKALPVYSINSLAYGALDILVKHKDYFTGVVREMVENRSRIIALYEKLGCQPFPSYTNFVMVEAPPHWNVPAYISFLKTQGILIRGPWTQDPYRNAFRITISTHAHIDRLEEATNAFGKKFKG